MTGDRYSRIIGWLKILLPIGALALLSTMFLFARSPGPQGDIPYAAIEALARDPRVTAPAFAGVTEDGAAVALTATTIRPDADRADAFGISDFRISLAAPDGQTVDVTAGEGVFDGRARTVVLTGLARVETSTGYLMETFGLTADLRAGSVETLGSLEVRTPFGALTAGKLTVTDGGARMVFNGGVRLLYQPGTEGSPP